MISLKVNQKDLDRIVAKLQRFGDEIVSQKGFVKQYQLYLLDAYKDTIVRAMGSVGMSGGRVNITFNITGMLTNGSTYWKALAPGTQDYKRALGLRAAIWEATGETKDSVAIYNDFVGISRSVTKDAFEKAINVEFGTTFNLNDQPPRALFTIANSIFMSQREKILEQFKVQVRNTKVKIKWGV